MSIKQNFPAIRPSLLLDFANTRTLDPRITFTRASTATFYDGKTTAVAEQNLFTYSQEFDNAYWEKNAGAITTNSTAAPDGTSTAETFTASASTATHGLSRSVTTTQATVSVFVKAGTHSFFQISSSGSSLNFANFNLTTGAVGTFGANATASIIDAGNGWYRCVVSFSTGSVSAILFRLVTSASAAFNESWAAAGTETVFLWGTQAENRSAATAYTPTTTQAITNYIPALQTAASGVARFDCSPTTNESLGLLIEESRVNGYLYSQDLTDAYWTKAAMTIESNVAIAPDGTLTADKIIPTATTENHNISRLGGTSTVNRTYSLYVKPAGLNYVTLGVSTTTSNALFNLIDGTVNQPTANFVADATAINVGNGWWRLTYTTATGTILAIYPGVAATKLSSGSSTTGDGYAGILVWGLQWENSVTFATSYIPTVASQVTRAADAASMTGENFSSWYRADGGTLYVGASPISAVGANNGGASQTPLRIYGGTGDIQFYRSVTTARVFVSSSSGTQADIAQSGFVAGSESKIVFGYKVNDFALSANGSAVATDTSGNPPISATSLGIGFYGSLSGGYLNGTIKKIAYYPLRVTNAQLQGLTS